MAGINPYPALRPLQGGAPITEPDVGPPVSLGIPRDDLIAAIEAAGKRHPPTWMEQLPDGDLGMDPQMELPDLPVTGDQQMMLPNSNALMQPQQNQGLDAGAPSPLALALMGVM